MTESRLKNTWTRTAELCQGQGQGNKAKTKARPNELKERSAREGSVCAMLPLGRKMAVQVSTGTGKVGDLETAGNT